MPYSEEVRLRALDIYKEHGLKIAVENTGVAAPTIIRWADKAGIRTDEIAKDINMSVEMSKARANKRRMRLKELMLDRALGILHRMDEPYEVVTKFGTEVFDKPPADAMSKFATALSHLVDKYRLMEGESTQNIAMNTNINEMSTEQLMEEIKGYLEA